MGQVKNRLAMWEPKTGPAHQQPVRRSWNKPWKKPKQDDELAAEPARGTMKATLAAIQHSVPQPAPSEAEAAGTPRRGLDALTPRRGSGDSTPRGKAALSSPFLKQVQELFSGGLRRSGSSNLGPSVPAAEPAEPQRDDFSPLGGGLAADKPATLAAELSIAAGETAGPAQEEQTGNPGSRLFASQLAAEAASTTVQRKGRFSLSRRKSKSPSPASPQPRTSPSPAPVSPGLPAGEGSLGGSAATAAMTMGAQDVSQQRKKVLRSPKRSLAQNSGERPQPRTPEASPAPAQPSPTLLSIQKLVAKQAASVGALHETGRARAVADALEAKERPKETGGGSGEGLPEAASKAAEEAADDDILALLQSSDSPRTGAHHRTGRRPASEDVVQVTSPIREKTELEGILSHARSTEGTAALPIAEADSAAVDTPAAMLVIPQAAEADVSSPLADVAGTNQEVQAVKTQESSASCGGGSGAPAAEAAADVQDSKEEAAQLAEVTGVGAESEGQLEAQAAQEQQTAETSSEAVEESVQPISSTSDASGAEGAPVTEAPVHEVADSEEREVPEVCTPVSVKTGANLEEAAGKERPPVVPSPKVATESQDSDAALPAENKAEASQPEESQLPASTQKQLRVAVPEARIRCSTPLFRPDSPARELESLDSPLLQATLEEPSPVHISLQGSSEIMAQTPTTPVVELSPCTATKQDSGLQETPLIEPAAGIVDGGCGTPQHDSTSGAASGSAAAADESPSVLKVDVHLGADGSSGAFTPEPSPSGERLVSERSLDEAEFVLLQEVMSKLLDPADQERVQAIADELFQEMQRKQEAASTDVDDGSPQFSLAKQPSSQAPSEISDVAAEETLDSSLHGQPPAQPPLPALQASTAEARRVTETPLLSPRLALLASPVRSPTLPVQRRSLSPLGRRSLATPPRPGSAKSGSSGASSELDSPLEEAMDELISHICDIEHMQVPVSTAKKAQLSEKERRTEDVKPICLDLEGPPAQEPQPDGPVTDALADSLAALQADNGKQELPEQEGGVMVTDATHEEPGENTAVEKEATEAAVIEVALEVIMADTHEEGISSSSGSGASIEPTAEGQAAAAPVMACSEMSPAPAAPVESETPWQQPSTARQSASKSPSPRRRPSPLQTALAATDENAAPASPAAGQQSLPRSPSPAARSPGTKPPTPKSAGALRTPLSPHGNAPAPAEAPAAAGPATVTEPAATEARRLPSGDEMVGDTDVTAQETLERTGPVSLTAGYATTQTEQPQTGTLPTADAAPEVEASPAAVEAPPEVEKPAVAAAEVAAEMETPVRGLRMLQGEPRNYADDDLLTPASVVPFPGFGDQVPATEEATPSTAPRVADPAPFLSNNNVVFSPDTPAEALSEASASIANERPSLRIRTGEGRGTEEQQRTPLETKFNLEDFSPPAARRISTGFTPPLHPSSARSAASALEASPPVLQQSSHPPKRVPDTDTSTFAPPAAADASAQQPPCSQALLQTPTAAAPTSSADVTTPDNAQATAEENAGNPDSPAFDESFAMDAQLVLGGLITPATAARPSAGQGAEYALAGYAPVSNGQRACEMVEEAAAEAGLPGTDTQRLVNALKPVLEGMLEDLEQQQRLLEDQDKSEQFLRAELQMLTRENEQLQAMVEKFEADEKELQEQHALTEQQFKILYRSKYLPLKEEHDRCSAEMQRLRDSRAAALEANEKWRTQVATAQLQVRKADLDADNAAHKIEQLHDELQGCRAEAEQAADALAAAEAEALRTSRKNSALEAQLRALQSEREALKAAAEEAETKVSAAQVARDRATKEVYTKDEEAEELRRRLRTFKAENDKFAGVKAHLQGDVAALQTQLAEEKRESHKLRKLCDGLMTDLENARQK